MARTQSATMTQILGREEHDLDWTIQITFPDSTVFRYATSPLTISSNSYTNDLESVSEIRQTLEAPADRVAVGIQNKDRVLGQHVATYWQKWRRAEAIVGRLYQEVVGGVKTGVTEWKEMFRGAVQQPNANDLQVTFDIIHDTLSPGPIVCSRTLGLPCPFVFKDAKTCAYSGSETLCDHHLKSMGGCDGRNNTHHFGGMEHRYLPESTVPGTGNNNDGGDGGTGPPACPRLDQYVLVKGPDGLPMPRMVCFFTDADELWDPVQRRFYKTRSAEIVRNQPIWEIIAGNGACGFSSFLHPIITDEQDTRGTAASKLAFKDSILTEVRGELLSGGVILSADTGSIGDVMKIDMDEGHIYCYGNSPDKLIACHNAKPVIFE